LLLFSPYDRYIAPPAAEATKAYFQAVSEYSDVPPAVFALSWVYHHPSVFATILGATSVEQLQDNVQALNVSPFPEDVREKFHEVIRLYVLCLFPEHNFYAPLCAALD